MLWRQSYGVYNKTLTYTPDINSAFSLKSRLKDNLKISSSSSCASKVPIEAAIVLPIYEAPFATPGDFSNFHFADMSNWNDSDSNIFRNSLQYSLNAWRKHNGSMFVIEGNTPASKGFDPAKFRNYFSTSQNVRLSMLGNWFKNPHFVNLYLLLTDPHISSDYTYINLDHAPK